MSLPNSQELELISQLRIRLSDLMPTLREEQKMDLFFVRWIRARENDLDLAEAMLRQSLKWREEFDIDNIGTWEPPETFTKICPAEFLGYSKNNSPVTYFPFGKWNLKKVVQVGEKDTFIKYIDKMFEDSIARMKGRFTSTGEPVSQLIFISNADQLSMSTMASMGAVDMMLQCVKRFEANQPETLGGVYIVNAGIVFASLFAMMKPLLSQRTFGKMHIFSSSTNPKCQQALHDNIPSDVLPPRLGGTKADFFDFYAVDPNPKEEGDEPDHISVTVPAGDKLILAFNLDEPDSTISWSFKTEKFDIAFSVHCEDKMYVENSRVNSHEKPQDGSIICQTAGEYVFTFDNTYSRLRTKNLQYKINIQTPQGADQIFFK